MGRRPASSQGDTKKDIQNAAFSLFGRYGYDGVSMLTVARATGITKAALYWYYDGKEALYTDCMHQLNAIFREHVLTRMQREHDPSARIMSIFEGMGVLLADSRVQEGVAGYWLQPSTADVPEALAAQAQFEETSARMIAQSIQAAVDSGQFDLSISVDEMAHAIIATMEAIVLPLRRSTPERSRRLIGVLAHTFFRAHSRGTAMAEEAINLAGRPKAPSAPALQAAHA